MAMGHFATKSQPSAHLVTVFGVPCAKKGSEITLLPRNDCITNQEEGGNKGEQDPGGIQNQGNANVDDGLADVIRVATEAVGARMDQLARCGETGVPDRRKW